MEKVLKEYNSKKLNDFLEKIKPELIEDSIKVEVQKFSSDFINVYGTLKNGLTMEIIIIKNIKNDADTVSFYINKNNLPIEKVEFFLLHKHTIEEHELDRNLIIRHDYFVVDDDIATTFNANYSFNKDGFIDGKELVRKVKYHNIVRYAGRDNLSNFAANLSMSNSPILFSEDKEVNEEPTIEFVTLKRNPERKKSIAIMLDIANTCHNITDNKAQIFMLQIEYLRKKFNADVATISLSTHFNDSNEIKYILNILKRNLTENIKIGINFFMGGTYDLENEQEDKYYADFNKDKVDTFDRYYISNPELDTKWFALIDDNLPSNVYKKYQHKYPMMTIRPSRGIIQNNNLMQFDTEEYAFDGVLNGMRYYIQNIEKLSVNEIFTEQKNFIEPISVDIPLKTKIKEQDYSYIERYFKEGFAIDKDYYEIIRWKNYLYYSNALTKEEYTSLMNILEILSEKFETLNADHSIQSVNELKRRLKRDYNY